MIPIELHIEPFNLSPYDSEDEIEVLICEVFNNEVENIIINSRTNFVGFNHKYGKYKYSFYINEPNINGGFSPDYDFITSKVNISNKERHIKNIMKYHLKFKY